MIEEVLHRKIFKFQKGVTYAVYICAPSYCYPFLQETSICFSNSISIRKYGADFEYFLHFRPYGIIGHAWLGFFYLNLPLGVFIAHALLDPYFQILQIGSIIVSGLISVLCGIFIASVVYQIRG